MFQENQEWYDEMENSDGFDFESLSENIHNLANILDISKDISQREVHCMFPLYVAGLGPFLVLCVYLFFICDFRKWYLVYYFSVSPFERNFLTFLDLRIIRVVVHLIVFYCSFCGCFEAGYFRICWIVVSDFFILFWNIMLVNFLFFRLSCS